MNARLSLLLCFVLVYKTDAKYGYGFMRCQFQSEDDALYTAEIYINKQIIGSYNSTEGKYTGYTEKTIEIANGLNKNPQFLAQEKKNQAHCKKGVPLLLKDLDTAVQKPQVKVSYTTTAKIIACSAYNFYPKPITLTWLRNGEEVTSDVVSTEEMSNGNWLYQKHSYLEYTPKTTDTIQCMVEHASLPSPELHKLEDFSASRKNKIIVGTAGLVLGLVFAAAGTIYYLIHKQFSVLEAKY